MHLQHFHNCCTINRIVRKLVTFLREEKTLIYEKLDVIHIYDYARLHCRAKDKQIMLPISHAIRI